MSLQRLSIVFLGLSLRSSWGNGHATTYRALIRALVRRGHDVLFLERDVPWYETSADQRRPDFCRLETYGGLEELDRRYGRALAQADVIIVGSYVPEGVAVAELALRRARGLVGFYDIDTPITLAKLARGEEEYIARRLVPEFDFYLSFAGGPCLTRLEQEFGARRPWPFYCMVDPALYRRTEESIVWDIGYLGTYSPDRQPSLDRLLIEPARRLPERRFVVAGAQYPADIDWPANVDRIEHVPPSEHASFYSRIRFALNLTRADMLSAGWAPSVRLFEAASCGTAILTDRWTGFDSFFPEHEAILIADDLPDVMRALSLDHERVRTMAQKAQNIVHNGHTGDRRAEELETVLEAAGLARPQGIRA